MTKQQNDCVPCGPLVPHCVENQRGSYLLSILYLLVYLPQINFVFCSEQSKLKRSNSESDLLAPMETDGDSELAKTFRRVRKKSTDSGDGGSVKKIF